MTTETQQQYEAQILQQLIKNSQELAVLQRDMEYLKDKTDRIEKDVEELKTDVKQLKTDVKELKTDVKQLKTDVEELKTDVKQLKTDIAELKPLKDKVDRAEWWFRAIAAGLIISFFKEQIWGLLS